MILIEATSGVQIGTLDFQTRQMSIVSISTWGAGLLAAGVFTDTNEVLAALSVTSALQMASTGEKAPISSTFKHVALVSSDSSLTCQQAIQTSATGVTYTAVSSITISSISTNQFTTLSSTSVTLSVVVATASPIVSSMLTYPSPDAFCSKNNIVLATSNSLTDQTFVYRASQAKTIQLNSFGEVTLCSPGGTDAIAYSIFKLNDGTAIPSYLSYTSEGLITADITAPFGVSYYKVYGALLNGQTNYYTLTVSGVNNKPTFSSNPVDQTVSLGKSATYQLPTYSDYENNAVTITTFDTLTSLLPTWVTYNSTTSTYTLAPTLYTHLVPLNLTVNISDPYQFTLLSFIVTATNTAPYFSAYPIAQSISYNSSGVSYTLPAVVDNEISDYAMTVTYNGSSTLPGFVSFIASAREFVFDTDNVANVGVYSFEIKVADGEPKHNRYNLSITVTNSKPIFSSALVDQVVPLNGIQVIYQLPSYSDPDGGQVSLDLTYQGGAALPTCLTFQNNEIKITPALTDFALLGTYLLDLSLTDSTGLSSAHTLKVTLTNSAPTLLTAPLSQVVGLNSILNYALPDAIDPEGQPITISILNQDYTAAPNFITIAASVISIKPVQFSEVGSYSILISVADGEPLRTNYTMGVTVINTAPYFTTIQTSYAEVMLGDTITYALPDIIDDEFNTPFVSILTSPTYISVIGITSLTIQPVLDSEVGTKIITIVLSDGNKSNYYTFSLVILTNLYPNFSVSTLTSFEMMVNSTFTYFLPSYSDPESRAVTLSYAFGGFTTSIGTDSFTIIQPSFSLVGAQQITVTLSDGFRLANYTILITVINTAPCFLDLPLANYTFQMNTSYTVTLPTPFDNEGNPVSVVPVDIPSYVAYQDPYKFVLLATQFMDLMTSVVKFNLSDTQMSTTYQFTLTIFNTAPYFATEVQSNVTVRFFSRDFEIALPEVVDDQNNRVYVTVKSNLTVTDNALVTVQCTLPLCSLMITPLSYDYVRTPTLLTITLNDTNLSTTHSVVLFVFNDAPVFTNGLGLVALTQKMNDYKVYEWPEYLDPEGDSGTMVVMIAGSSRGGSYMLEKDYISVDNIGVYVQATEFEQVGTQYFTIALRDGEPKETRYTLAITITNSAPYFIGNPTGKLGTVKVRLGQGAEWDLPPFKDDEGNPVFLKHKLPSGNFITFNEKRYTFSPTQLEQIGTYQITGSIYDGQPLSSPFSLTLTVFNDPPYLSQPLPAQLTAYLYQQSFFVIPEAKDREGLGIALGVSGAGRWSSFVSLQQNQTIYTLVIGPDDESHIGDYQLMITLIDTAKATRIYNFKLVVKDQGALAAGQLGNSGLIDIRQNRTRETKKLGLRAYSMSKEGLLKVKFTNAQGLRVINMSEAFFKIRVIDKEEQVAFSLSQYDSTIMQFQLSFTDIKEISNSIDLDTVELTVNQTVLFTENFLQNYTLLKGTQTSIQVPPQLSKDSAYIAAKFKSSANLVSTAAVPGGLVLNMTLSLFIQYLWSLLNDLSFLTALTLISFTVPGIAQLIQSAMLSFIYLDVLQTDKWLTPLIFPNFNEDTDGESQAINEQFSQNGFTSMMLVSNLGSTFVYLLILILLIVIMVIAKSLSYFKVMKQIGGWLETRLIWNYSLRFLIQQFPPLMISSLINMYQFEYNAAGEALSTTLSMVLIALTQVIIIALFVVLFKYRHTYKSKVFLANYGTLFQGVNPSRVMGRNWHPFNMLRWTLTSAIMVCLREYYALQMILLLAISLAFQMLLFLGKPLETKAENGISVFNEVMICCYLYILLVLTEFNGSLPVEREDLGTLLVITILISSLVNFMKFFAMLFFAVKEKIQGRLIRQERAKKSEEAQQHKSFKQYLEGSQVKVKVTGFTMPIREEAKRRKSSFNVEDFDEPHNFDKQNKQQSKRAKAQATHFNQPPYQVQSILDRISAVTGMNNSNQTSFTDQTHYSPPTIKKYPTPHQSKQHHLPIQTIHNQFEQFVISTDVRRQQIERKYESVGRLQTQNKELMDQLERNVRNRKI